jgi:peptidyl-prolyl cis-trans isomerase D
MIRFLQTKGPIQKILLVGFLAIICIMMVVTLVPGGILNEFGITHEGLIAKVGSEQITAQDVNQQANQIARSQFPRGAPPQLRPYLMQQAAESLMMQGLLLNEANRMGFHTTDEELRYELQHGGLSAQLFPNGNFVGADQYKAFVSTNFNLTVSQFEDKLKRQITMNKLRNAIEGGATVSSDQLVQQFRQANTKVKFDYAVIALQDVAKQVKPTDAELRAFYEKSKAQYANSIPEKRKASYIPIDQAKLPNPPKVTAEDLQSYYNAHQDQFRVPESVTVRHILIRTPTAGPDGKVDPKAVAEARAKAEDILKQLKAGADFATLAKKFSQDPASAPNGGFLGPITRGRTVPEFEKTAFATPKGQTSGVIQTDYGFHILHVDDKAEAHVKTMAEAKPEIEPVIARDKAKAAAETLARTMEAEARTGGMEKAAKNHGLQVVGIGYFVRSESLPGIGNAPAFMDAMFTTKPMAPPVAVATPQGFAILQVTDVKPPSSPTYEEAKDRVEQQFRTDRAQSMLSQKTQELSDRARAGHNLRAAAKELGATLHTSEFVSPEGQVPEIGALTGPAAQIFTMKQGEISGPLNTARGGVVMMLLEKQEPSMANFDQQKDEIRQQLLQRRQTDMFEIYLANLRKVGEQKGIIKIFNKEFTKLMSSTNTGE